MHLHRHPVWLCLCRWSDMYTGSLTHALYLFQGRRNYLILMLAVCFAVTGSVLTGLSKWDKWNHTDDDKTLSTSITTAATVVYATDTATVYTSNN